MKNNKPFYFYATYSDFDMEHAVTELGPGDRRTLHIPIVTKKHKFVIKDMELPFIQQ